MVRPQSLIGEKFVECKPTQPRAPGTPPPPLLPEIKHGPGKGQYLLPSTNTAKAIDIDLINNIMRLPLRERFTIIINELGTGLAGNGAALNAALKQANPAFKAFDQVLAILAQQNRTLASLAVNGDTVLAPLARDRGRRSRASSTPRPRRPPPPPSAARRCRRTSSSSRRSCASSRRR